MQESYHLETSFGFSAVQLQCEQCGTLDPTGQLSACQLCGGQMQQALPPAMDLGVDLASLTEGVDALSVHRVLARYAHVCDVSFCLGQNDLTPEQVFQPESMMPVIAIDALRIWQSLERRPGAEPLEADSLQVEFHPVEGGFFKYSAFAPAIGSDLTSTLRLLVFLLAARRVLGMVPGQKIDLTPRILMWDKINWDTDVLPELHITDDYDPMFHHLEFALVGGAHKPAPTNASADNPFASQG